MGSWQAIKTKRSLDGWFLGNESLSRRHEGKNPYPARGKPILRFLWINNQNYWPIGGIRHIFSVQLYTGSLWLIILFYSLNTDMCANFYKKRIVQHADGFGCFTDYSLWTVVIRLYVYFTDLLLTNSLPLPSLTFYVLPPSFAKFCDTRISSLRIGFVGGLSFRNYEN